MSQFARFAGLVLLSHLLGSIPGYSQDSASPAEKWRPKDGTYAAPDQHFDAQCGEFGDIAIELAEGAVTRSEQNCKIRKLLDTAPFELRLDLICDDYNLAESIGDPNPHTRKFKEIVTLKKVDDKTIAVRKTLNGKFTSSAWQASYCPEEKQRWFYDARQRAKAEAAQKSKR